MITLLSDRFVLQPVSVNDLQIASLAWGFTIGFGFLTVWNAITQTMNMFRRYGYSKLNSPYIWMIWLEISVCLIFSVICWMHLNAFIPPSFAFYFVILTTWALQVQFLLQIIINRVSILLTNRRHAMRLKIGVAILITAINISVYCIWVPARLQISEGYERLNDIWDRCEKVIYLLVDGTLNWYFMRIVRKKLVNQGLVKYDRLVRFNLWIIGFSLGMDVLIISMMSLKNSFVYMQFHPLAYIVKLNIEMSMADLIAKVARTDPHNNSSSHHTSYLRSQNHDTPYHKSAQNRVHTEVFFSPDIPNAKPKTSQYGLSTSASSTVELDDMARGIERGDEKGEGGRGFGGRAESGRGNYEINVRSEVQVRIEEMESVDGSTKEGSLADNAEVMVLEDDERPLRDEDIVLPQKTRLSLAF